MQVFQPVLQWWNDRPVLLIIRSAKACLWPRLSEPKSFSTLRPMEYRPAKYVLYVVVVVSRTVVVLRNLVFLPTSAEAWQNVAAKIFCKSCDWFIAVHGLLLPFISLISKQFVHVVVFQFGRNCEIKQEAESYVRLYNCIKHCRMLIKLGASGSAPTCK